MDRFERRVVLTVILALLVFLCVSEQITYGKIDPQLWSLLGVAGAVAFGKYTRRKDDDDKDEDGKQ